MGITFDFENKINKDVLFYFPLFSLNFDSLAKGEGGGGFSIRIYTPSLNLKKRKGVRRKLRSDLLMSVKNTLNLHPNINLIPNI